MSDHCIECGLVNGAHYRTCSKCPPSGKTDKVLMSFGARAESLDSELSAGEKIAIAEAHEAMLERRLMAMCLRGMVMSGWVPADDKRMSWDDLSEADQERWRGFAAQVLYSVRHFESLGNAVEPRISEVWIPAFEWRGDPEDFAKRLSVVLSPDELEALSGEVAIAWRFAAKFKRTKPSPKVEVDDGKSKTRCPQCKTVFEAYPGLGTRCPNLGSCGLIFEAREWPEPKRVEIEKPEPEGGE